LPALLLIVVMGFLTAVIRPILVSRIQDELSDDIRATMLSMQSLTFTLVAAISQPSLGAVASAKESRPCGSPTEPPARSSCIGMRRAALAGRNTRSSAFWT